MYHMAMGDTVECEYLLKNTRCWQRPQFSVPSYLDAVPSAVTQAWNIPMKKVKGFCFTITKYMSGRKMPPWMIRPTITVTMYMPSCLATTSRSAMEMIFPQMRQAIPKGEYLQGDTR